MSHQVRNSNASATLAAADEFLADAIWRISDKQLAFTERVGALVIMRRGHIEFDSSPMCFTAFNDLSLAYLAPHVLKDQGRIVRQVSAVALPLRFDLFAYDLANKILGAERAHVDNLRRLIGGPTRDSFHKSVAVGLSGWSCQDQSQSVVTAA